LLYNVEAQQYRQIEYLVEASTDILHELNKDARREIISTVLRWNVYMDTIRFLRLYGSRPKLANNCLTEIGQFTKIWEMHVHQNLKFLHNPVLKKEVNALLKVAMQSCGDKAMRSDLTGDGAPESGSIYAMRKFTTKESHWSRPLCFFMLVYTAHVMSFVSKSNPGLVRGGRLVPSCKHTHPLSSNQRAQLAFTSGQMTDFKEFRFFSQEFCGTMEALAFSLFVPICQQTPPTSRMCNHRHKLDFLVQIDKRVDDMKEENGLIQFSCFDKSDDDQKKTSDSDSDSSSSSSDDDSSSSSSDDDSSSSSSDDDSSSTSSSDGDSGKSAVSFLF